MGVSPCVHDRLHEAKPDTAAKRGRQFMRVVPEQKTRVVGVGVQGTRALPLLLPAGVLAGALLFPTTSHAVEGMFRIAPILAPHKSWDLPGSGCPYNAGNTPSSLALYTHDNLCSNGDQRWYIHDMGGGQHEIRQGGSGGKCLDIDGGGTGSGLGTYTCVGGSNQRWYFTETTGAGTDGLYGQWEIKSVRDGRVIDLTNWNTANATSIGVYTDLDNGAQRWVLWTNGGMHQDWADDFNGSSLDTGAWTALTVGAEWRNNEDQRYTPSRVSVSGGSLNIDAVYTCANGQTGSNCYESGRINSKGKRWGRNGMFSARVRYTESGGNNMGTWPAFWLLGNSSNESPTNGTVGSGACWPNTGSREIDIWEWVRNNNGATYINNAIYHDGFCTYTYNGQSVNTPSWNWGDWIVVAVKIDGGRVKFYRQGIKTHDISDAGFVNEDFGVIFNMAVGGDLGGADFDFNASYKWAKTQVDWVTFEKW
jgi:hypothetical protein